MIFKHPHGPMMTNSLIAQPKKVLAHDPEPLNESDPHGIRIVLLQQQN
jgi:hypothetical protein